jgi:DNA-binding MarR family transcriptional regulator
MASKTHRSKKRLVSDARAAIADCAGLNARTAARRIARFMDARLRGAGLSFAQFGLMTYNAAARDDTIGNLAERTGLDQSTMSRNLRNLEDAGLIEIAVVESDLRRRAVWLTERGARRLETAMAAWKRAQAELATCVDPEQLRRLAADTKALTQREAEAG